MSSIIMRQNKATNNALETSKRSGKFACHFVDIVEEERDRVLFRARGIGGWAMRALQRLLSPVEHDLAFSGSFQDVNIFGSDRSFMERIICFFKLIPQCPDAFGEWSVDTRRFLASAMSAAKLRSVRVCGRLT